MCSSNALSHGQPGRQAAVLPLGTETSSGHTASYKNTAHHSHKQQCPHHSQLHAGRQPIKKAEEASSLGLLRAAAAAGSAAHQLPLLLLLLLKQRWLRTYELLLLCLPAFSCCWEW
jgi:hypothetical protein